MSAAAGCVFCRVVSGEVPATLVHSDDDVVAFHDLSPQAPIHVLVVPRMHVRTFSELGAGAAGAGTVGALMSGVARTVEVLGLTEADGYRVLVNCGERASQSVFHVHVHVMSGRRFGWPPG